jgi:hypothetical protein
MSMASRQDYRAYPDPLPWRPSPPLVPEAPSAATVIQAMMGMLARSRPGSDSQALRLLRDAFPDHPLSVRLAALAHMPR